jgi:hypothetical protein
MCDVILNRGARHGEGPYDRVSDEKVTGSLELPTALVNTVCRIETSNVVRSLAPAAPPLMMTSRFDDNYD